MNCKAIVLAAGRGKRMGGDVPKQFLELKGRPLIYYPLKCFEETPWISEIVLVTGEDTVSYVRDEIVARYGFQKVKQVIPGGKERYDSVYEGLKCIREGCDYVFIHDGARPLVDRGILERTLEAVLECGACVAAVPSKDTVKTASPDGFVEKTLDRSVLWNIQTPQVFDCDMIVKAHEEIRKGDMAQVTDDAMIVETLGVSRVKLVMGSYDNIKITTPEDLPVAENILKGREDQ